MLNNRFAYLWAFMIHLQGFSANSKSEFYYNFDYCIKYRRITMFHTLQCFVVIGLLIWRISTSFMYKILKKFQWILWQTTIHIFYCISESLIYETCIRFFGETPVDMFYALLTLILVLLLAEFRKMCIVKWIFSALLEQFYMNFVDSF